MEKRVLWSSGSGRVWDANTFQVRSFCYAKLSHIVLFTKNADISSHVRTHLNALENEAIYRFATSLDLTRL